MSYKKLRVQEICVCVTWAARVFVFVCEKLEMAVFKYLVLLHTDVPKAAQFYAHGLGLAVNVCTLRWAELQSGPCKIALMQAPRYNTSLSLDFLVFQLGKTCLVLGSEDILLSVIGNLFSHLAGHR